jgi:hypothetical protein
VALAGTTMGADAISSGVQGIDTERAIALGRALLSKLGPSELLEAFGPPAAFAAGMWPKPTASPALDEAPLVHDVPDPENGVARSEDSDGPVGAQINESKKDFRRKRDQAKAAKDKKSGGTSASGNTPPPNQPEPNDGDKPPIYKHPNDDSLEVGDNIDIDRFSEEESQTGQAKKRRDPDTGYTIQRDHGEHGRVDPRYWKLRDNFGRLRWSLSESGKVLARKTGPR